MVSSHEWSILREMDAEGRYPEVLWGLADAMAENRGVMAGKLLTVEESYRSSLGCPS